VELEGGVRLALGGDDAAEQGGLSVWRGRILTHASYGEASRVARCASREEGGWQVTMTEE
jgi:hypothetical protein